MTLFVSLLIAALYWSAGTSLDDLVERDGRFYKQFPGAPFTGEIDEGSEQGSLQNGEKEGPWVRYYIDGPLFHKGDYKDGKLEGPYVGYWENGQVMSKGDLKNGKREGPWVYYHDNGQLKSKGAYKNGKRDGPQVSYDDNGFIERLSTGTYKDGEKISD